MWGSLQPHVPLRPADLFQLCPEAAFQKHVFLLPSTHLQTEGSTSAMLRRDTDNRYLPLHPCVQLRGVQLNKCVMEKDPLAETHLKKNKVEGTHYCWWFRATILRFISTANNPSSLQEESHVKCRMHSDFQMSARPSHLRMRSASQFTFIAFHCFDHRVCKIADADNNIVNLEGNLMKLRGGGGGTMFYNIWEI